MATTILKPTLEALNSVPVQQAVSKANRRIDVFSRETTIHGFRELNNSQRWWQKCLWISVIIASAVCFLLHARTQFQSYIDERTAMSVGTMNPQEHYPFPNVMLAIPAWIWMDPRKLAKYNITYEQLTVAKSFLKPKLQYQSDVPLEVAKADLFQKVKSMNITGIRRFFTALAREDAAGLIFDPLTPNHSNESKVSTRALFSGGVCYYILNTTGAYKSLFGSTYSIAFVFDFSVFLGYLKEHVADGGAADKKGNDTPSTIENVRPWLRSSDFTGQIYVQPGYQYIIHYDIRIYRPLAPCDKQFDADPLYGRGGCEYACEIKANVSFNASSCYRYYLAVTHYTTATWPLCSKGFYVNKTLTDYGADQRQYRNLTDWEVKKRDEMLAACVRDECKPPCSHWLTSASFTASEIVLEDGSTISNFSVIEIYYPDRTSVTVMEEKLNYLWHDLASDIGGLLGLWLGASVLSLCQLVHLCTCGVQLENERGAEDTTGNQ